MHSLNKEIRTRAKTFSLELADVSFHSFFYCLCASHYFFKEESVES